MSTAIQFEKRAWKTLKLHAPRPQAAARFPRQQKVSSWRAPQNKQTKGLKENNRAPSLKQLKDSKTMAGD